MTSLPVQLEQSDSDGSALSVPGVIAGRLEQQADIDRYSFEVRKGQRLTFEVFARTAAV
ncbi:MAG: hypothetical protein R3C49_16145 [Planctomycetaceae bacterium]